MRLNRFIAACGLCSRRKADALILAGKVAVNGAVCANPATTVRPSDCVEVDGKPLTQQRHEYVMLNKPIQVVSTASDPQGRQTVLDLLPPELRRLRLCPVGRLDYFSEGLLLLTNDGELANALLHPRYHQPREYEVRIRGGISSDALSEMREGMALEGGEKLLPVKLAQCSLPNGDTLLKMELRQGVNRQIRRMCDKLGLQILKLKRIRMGALELGALKPGSFRKLCEEEIAALRRGAAEALGSQKKTGGQSK